MYRIISIVLFVTAHLTLVQPIRGHFRLQILHNNDLHARFVETDAYTASCPDEFVKQNKCFGGFARMKKAADDARAEARRQNVSSIFINAGDSFQGTPYYSLYKWQVVQELIDKIGLDVMSLGNHEFDDGIENLVQYLKHVKVPVVCANLNLTTEKRLNLPNLTPSKVLTVEGRKIGIIGYLTPETEHISNTENLKILPEIPSIRAEAKRLKAQGINIIIALGHSGFDFDVQMANEIEELSLVVGGHSHTLLYTPKDKPPSVEEAKSEYPTLVTQPSGKIVPVVQAYAYCKYLGKLLVDFDDQGNVISATGNPQLLDGTVKKDPELDKEISKWSALVNERIKVVKGYTRTFLGKSDFNAGQFESNLANLITDSYVDFGAQLAHELKEPTWTKTPIAFYQNGGIRAVLDNKKSGGALTIEDLMMVMPFENKLCAVKLRGSTIRKALEMTVSTFDSESNDYRPSHFLHFSGLRVTYDLSKPPGERVANAEALCQRCAIPRYQPLEDNRVYGVITSSFLADGGDKFDMIRDEALNKTMLHFYDIDPLLSFVEKNRVIHPILDDRMIVTGFKLKNSDSASSASLPSSNVFLPLFAFALLLRMFTT